MKFVPTATIIQVSARNLDSPSELSDEGLDCPAVGVPLSAKVNKKRPPWKREPAASTWQELGGDAPLRGRHRSQAVLLGSRTVDLDQAPAGAPQSPCTII